MTREGVEIELRRGTFEVVLDSKIVATIERGNLQVVSQAEHIVAEKVLEDLPAEERAWLDEQLVIYRDLLAYLHDH